MFCNVVVSVTKELTVLLSDRALARELHPDDYWKPAGAQRSLPVRWASLETLEIEVFTSKSDVVSDVAFLPLA